MLSAHPPQYTPEEVKAEAVAEIDGGTVYGATSPNSVDSYIGDEGMYLILSSYRKTQLPPIEHLHPNELSISVERVEAWKDDGAPRYTLMARVNFGSEDILNLATTWRDHVRHNLAEPEQEHAGLRGLALLEQFDAAGLKVKSHVGEGGSALVIYLERSVEDLQVVTGQVLPLATELLMGLFPDFALSDELWQKVGSVAQESNPALDA